MEIRERRRSAIKVLLLVLASGLPWAPARAQNALPAIGDPTRAVFTRAEERELREMFLHQIKAQLPIVEDPEINEYARSLGQRLVAASDNAEQNFEFLVIDESAINAFAGPGGVIGINTGLIQASASESELAAVVAHEIAHVTQRHLARSFAQGSRSNLPALAGLAAALILATQSPEAGQAALATMAASSIQRKLDFTRANEKEADRVGIQLLARAGFDPRAMPSFFERLQQANRYSQAPLEFLSTHPVTTSRIADSRNRAEQYPYRQIPDGLSYQLARAKIQVANSPNPNNAVAEAKSALDRGQYRNALAARYRLALAYVAAKRWPQARRELILLLRKDADRIQFRTALAGVETAMGRLGVAMGIYEETAAIYPTNLPVVAAYTEMLVDAGRYRKALEVLSEFRRNRQLDARLYRLEAEAQSRLGNPFDSSIALAEYHYLRGDLDAAIYQLGRALSGGASDFYGKSRAEARLAQLREEQAARQR